MMAEYTTSTRMNLMLRTLVDGLNETDDVRLAGFYRIASARLRSPAEQTAAYAELATEEAAAGAIVTARSVFLSQSTNPGTRVFEDFVADTGLQLEVAVPLLSSRTIVSTPDVAADGAVFALSDATNQPVDVASAAERAGIATPTVEVMNLIPLPLRPYAERDPLVAERARRMREYVRQYARLRG